MLTTGIIFTASFCSVFLGCLQSVNVVHGRRLWAAITSVAQGMSVLTLYRLVPKVETFAAAIAFLTAGVIGGQLSMHVTRKLRETKRPPTESAPRRHPGTVR